MCLDCLIFVVTALHAPRGTPSSRLGSFLEPSVNFWPRFSKLISWNRHSRTPTVGGLHHADSSLSTLYPLFLTWPVVRRERGVSANTWAVFDRSGRTPHRSHPPSPFFTNVEYVRKTKILAEQQPPQGVLARDHAGPVINFSFRVWQCLT